MHARVFSVASVGLEPHIIDVEIDMGRGLHSFSIVGLPDKAVEEAKDRISAAIKNSNFEPPHKGNKKIVVSLAPADLKKEGAGFDLPIALATLLAAREIEFSSRDKLFIGELSLTGEVRPVRGALIAAQAAHRAGLKELYCPKENAKEASLVRGIRVFPVRSLLQLINHLDTSRDEQSTITSTRLTKPAQTAGSTAIDFADIAGHEEAKRGLLIAAAGRHNVALSGPPGTGKSLLAKAFAGILPPLTYKEVVEVTGIHSVAGILKAPAVSLPPVRAPHHTASYVSLIGGGTYPKPGEVTLAHRGVLFLDEFPEFDRRVVESLRQPLEDNVVRVSRARGTIAFPANFMLILAMNLCPCANIGRKNKACTCSAAAIARYQRKMSGPIADRIDIFLSIPELEHKKLHAKISGERSEILKERVLHAREIQEKRYAQFDTTIQSNADMTLPMIKELLAELAPDVRNLLTTSAQKLSLSPRGYHKVLKLSRTIADLEASEVIGEEHVLEALQYRPREHEF